MINFKSFILVIFLVIASLSFAQTKPARQAGGDEELIDWSATRRLTWDDYKGKPDPNSDAAASTTSYLGIEYNFSNNKITYKIACRFSKNQSWGFAKTDYILGHEQGHFDITEIFARKLNKLTVEYKFNKNTFREDLQKIYEDIQEEKEKFQNQYDNETDYSRNKEKQVAWLKKIEKMLEEYKDFTDYN